MTDSEKSLGIADGRMTGVMREGRGSEKGRRRVGWETERLRQAGAVRAEEVAGRIGGCGRRVPAERKCGERPIRPVQAGGRLQPPVDVPAVAVVRLDDAVLHRIGADAQLTEERDL